MRLSLKVEQKDEVTENEFKASTELRRDSERKLSDRRFREMRPNRENTEEMSEEIFQN